MIRLANEDDIPYIKKIADKHVREIGFVNRTALQISCKRGWLLYHPEGAFCHFRVRKDGVTVIYEILVNDDVQGKGIGKSLIYLLSKPIQLKCPVDNKSNNFYKHLGFQLIGKERGKKRELNIWRLE